TMQNPNILKTNSGWTIYGVDGINNAGLMVGNGRLNGGPGGGNDAVLLAPLPTVTIAATTPTAVEGGASGLFTVTRTGSTVFTLQVDYAASGSSTATSGADYAFLSGSVLILPGVSSAIIPIAPLQDVVAEGDETVILVVSAPAVSGVTRSYAVGGSGFGVVTIQDDDSGFAFSSSSVTVAESVGSATITVARIGASATTQTVNFATSNGTAIAPGDYIATAGTLTFAPGVASQTFLVPIFNDLTPESTEGITLTLSGATGGAGLGSPSVATLNITDNDGAPAQGQFAFTSSSFSGNEGGSVSVTVSRSGGTLGTVGVAVTVVGGTAISGTDYSISGSPMSWGNGIGGNQTVTIGLSGIFNDALPEDDETILLKLSSPTGNATIDSTADAATVTIRDNDAGLAFVTTSSYVYENGNGPGLRVRRVGSTGSAASVNFTVTPGTATQGMDYNNSSGTLTWSPGNSYSNFININPQTDSQSEPEEFVTVTLSGASGASIVGGSSGSLGIRDSNIEYVLVDLGGLSGSTSSSATGVNSSGSISLDSQDATGLQHAVRWNSATRALEDLGVINVGGTPNKMNTRGIDDAGRVVGAATNGRDDQDPLYVSKAFVSAGGGAATVLFNDGSNANPNEAYAVGTNGIVGTKGGQPFEIATLFGVSGPDTNLATTYLSSPPRSFAQAIAENFVTGAVQNPAGNGPVQAYRLTLGGGPGSTLYLNTPAPWDYITGLSVNALGHVAFDTGLFQGKGNGGSGFWDGAVTLGISPPAGYAMTGANGINASDAIVGSANDAGNNYSTAILWTASGGTRDLNALVPSGSSIGWAAGINDSGVIVGEGRSGGSGGQHAVMLLPMPTVSVSASSVAAEAGLVPGSFTVTRTGSTLFSLVVSYSSNNGNATAGVDYVALSGTVTIPAGSSSATITVTPFQDAIPEGSEQVGLNINNPPNSGVNDTFIIGAGYASVIILDDDNGIAFDNGGFWVTEGQSQNVTIRRIGSSSGTQTVEVSTGAGSATAGSDYTAFSGQVVSFLDGENQKDITVQTLQDTLVEPTEAFTLILSNPSPSVALGTAATVNIQDDDVGFTFNAPSYTINENGGMLNVSVNRSGLSNSPVSVVWSTVDGTANGGGVDYTGSAGTTLNFGSWQNSQNISIPINNDSISEADETFTIQLTSPNPTSAVLPSPATVTIIDDDGGMQFQFLSNQVGESSGPAQVAVQRIGSPATTVSIDVVTSDNGATAGQDYTAVTRTLTWGPGDISTKFASIPITTDTQAEGNEDIRLTMNNPVGAGARVIGSSTATLTIIDDDTSVRFDQPSYQMNEVFGSPTLNVGVSRIGSLNGTLTVTVMSTSGTAGGGSDYNNVNMTLTFGPGVSGFGVGQNAITDGLFEGDESYTLSFTSPVAMGVNLDPTPLPTATVTIIDNDTSVQFASANTNLAENVTPGLVTITRTGSLAGTATVNFSTSAGTAIAGGTDYNDVTTSVTFPPGSPSETVAIPVNNDTMVESPETINLSLSGLSVTGASMDVVALGVSSATATILDDDSGIRFTSATFSGSENGGTILVTVARVGSTAAAQIDVSTVAGGTATPGFGNDYTVITNQTVFWAGGEADGQTHPVAITINNDTLAENDETIIVQLSNAIGATLGAPAAATVTIIDDDPVISMATNAITVAESGTASITVNRAGGMSMSLSPTYSTGGGTATSGPGGDYTLPSTVLSFGPGVTTQIISVPITSDTLPEPDETFIVTLTSAGAGGSLGVQPATTVTITDDDPQILMNGSTASVPEGSAAIINVTRSGGLTMFVGANYSTSNLTAAAPGDYASASGIISFGPGSTSGSISVSTVPDNSAETDETFRVTLTGATGGASLGATTTDVTIIDDDARLTFGSATVNVSESVGTASFTVTRTGALSTTVGVSYATSNASAIAGTDYSANSGSLTFAPNILSQTILVAITPDSVPETDKTFVLTLSSPTGGSGLGSQPTQTVTILDDDPVISVASATGSVGEASGPASIVINRVGGLSMAVGATYGTADGSAFASSDYTATTGTVSFAANATTQTITVPISNDTTAENDETFTLTLTLPTGGATLGTAARIETIIDNDPQIAFASATGSVGEASGSASITVSRIGGLTMTVGATFGTADGTANAGSDYTTATGTVTFVPGSLSQTISVPITSDTAPESDETFIVTLSAPSGGATLGTPASTTETIVDDDAQISLAVSTASIGESAGPLTITVTRVGGLSMTVGASYTTADVTAAAGSDYTATVGTVTFPAGSISQTVSVPITSDGLAEIDESFTFALSVPTGGAILIAPTSETVTIVDDDPVISVSAAGSIGEASGPASITVSGVGGLSMTVGATYG
ncbi:MAG: hypothetical protein H0W83_05965, partial [Planctomycetes bacterium]|nr:hypothetical protein [Planctomycetota bacterium]